MEGILNGMSAKKVTRKILTAASVNDHNTFEKPNTVAVKDFDGAKLNKVALSVKLPSNSIVMLEIE